MLEAIKNEFTDKNVAVVGYGVFGRSAVEFIEQCSPSNLTVLDENSEVEVADSVQLQSGEGALDGLEKYDIVVRSPGVSAERLTGARSIITDTQLLLKYFRNQTIGITGTKGKSTTASITAKLLEACGVEVLLAGNIGRSFFDIFTQITDETVVVAELSSYQLSDVSASPHWSVLLPVASDHLTWHGSQAEYEKAKAHIFQHQTSEDVLVYWGEGKTKQFVDGMKPASMIIDYRAGSDFRLANNAIVFSAEVEVNVEHKVLDTAELQMKGEHNFYNIIASLSIVRQVLSEREQKVNGDILGIFAGVLRSFTPLDHHLQTVGNVEGVTFIDDSYASTPVATEAALKTITGPKVLIFGGQSRGLELSSVFDLLEETEVEAIVLIGVDDGYLQQIESRINNTNKTEVITLGDTSMEQIVRAAFKRALGQGSVVLSPGHPSFDMFENFVDRGEQFQEAVRKLEVGNKQ